MQIGSWDFILRITFCSYTQVGLSCTKLSYEELNFKFSTYFTIEALNPHLSIGAVGSSCFQLSVRVVQLC